MGDIKESYEAWVDGKQVVLGYRAFAEEGKPYCISVKLPDGGNIYATFQPSVPDDPDFGSVTPEECEEHDRRQIIKWVNALGDLIERAYPVEIAAEDFADIYEVYSLGYNETDEIWIDADGDAYKYDPSADKWFIAVTRDGLFDNTQEWRPLSRNSPLLREFGPYTVWRKPEPEVPQVLTNHAEFEAAPLGSRWKSTFTNGIYERNETGFSYWPASVDPSGPTAPWNVAHPIGNIVDAGFPMERV